MFRRNYSIAGVGEAHCRELDHYIANQPDRHAMADRRVQQQLAELQFHDPAVDLCRIRTTSHGQYVYGLQVVVENELGWHETRREILNESLETIRAVAKKSDWLLSRIGIVTNHLHVLLGPAITDSAETVALSLMNSLAFTQNSKPILRHSYYVGTFGKYDRNAIRHRL
jgi:REP element-mobilizing transposase RayT